MEVAALMLIFIPACMLGFLIGILGLFRKSNASILLSIVFAIAFGYASIFMVGIFNDVWSESKDYIGKRKDVGEVKYFEEALAGKYHENEIRAHYREHPINDYVARAIMSDKRIWETSIPDKIIVDPNMISAIMDIFKNYRELIGLLANLSETPVELKLMAAERPEIEAVLGMARNEQTPPEVLIKLATHENLDYARIAIENKKAPEEARLIFEIRSSLSYDVLHPKEGKNPPGFDTVLQRSVWLSLVQDKREFVRLWVAQHPFAPSSMLSSLSHDSSNEVLKWVFLNKNATKDSKKRIANRYSTNEKNLLIDLSKDKDPNIRQAVASNTEASTEILKTLSTDEYGDVRLAVVKNQNASAEILNSLYGYDDEFNYALAKNRHTSIERLKALIAKKKAQERLSSNESMILRAASDNLKRRGVNDFDYGE